MAGDQNSKELLTMEELLMRIRDSLETAWNAVSPDSHEARALADAWTDAQLLKASLDHTEKLLADTLWMAEQFKSQRDMAVEDVEYWRNENRDSGIRLVAYYMAQQSGISIGDAQRIIGLIMGDLELPVSEYTKEDFIAAVKQLAMELLEEELLAADAEAEDQRID
jgi:hypothetical protein